MSRLYSHYTYLTPDSTQDSLPPHGRNSALLLNAGKIATVTVLYLTPDPPTFVLVSLDLSLNRDKSIHHDC